MKKCSAKRRAMILASLRFDARTGIAAGTTTRAEVDARIQLTAETFAETGAPLTAREKAFIG